MLINTKQDKALKKQSKKVKEVFRSSFSQFRFPIAGNVEAKLIVSYFKRFDAKSVFTSFTEISYFSDGT